jgi:hypothetical protein
MNKALYFCAKAASPVLVETAYAYPEIFPDDESGLDFIISASHSYGIGDMFFTLAAFVMDAERFYILRINEVYQKTSLEYSETIAGIVEGNSHTLMNKQLGMSTQIGFVVGAVHWVFAQPLGTRALYLRNIERVVGAYDGALLRFVEAAMMGCINKANTD